MAVKKQTAQQKKKNAQPSDTVALHLIGGLVLIALGVFIFLSVVLRMSGDVFAGLRRICFGMAGLPSLLLPVFFVWGGGLLLVSAQRKVSSRAFVLSTLIYLLLLTSCNLLTYTGAGASPVPLLDYFASQGYGQRTYGSFLQRAYTFSSGSSAMGRAGGWLGMMLGWPLWKGLGSVPAAVVCILSIIALTLLLIRPDFSLIAAKWDAHRAQREQQRQAEEAARLAALDAQGVKPPQPLEQSRQLQRQAWQQYQQQSGENAGFSVSGYGVPPAPAYPPQTPTPPATPYGFQPTEEESHVYQQPVNTPAPRRKSRIFGGKPENAAPTPSRTKKSIFGPSDDAAPAEDTQAARKRKASIFGRPQTETPQPFTEPFPAPPQPQVIDGQMVQPWQSRTASAPVAPVSATPTPHEEDRPYAHSAKVPPVKPQATGRVSKAAPKQQPKPSWTEDDTPPWEEKPAAPQTEARAPVVAQQSPDGWLPELDLAPVKEGQATLGQKAAKEAPAPVPYVYPGLELLRNPPEQTGISPEEDAMRAQRLEETLASFKVQAKVRHITHGPAISRFELELAAGINVNRVTNLGANIAMNMEVKSVRIEAPIPGKSLVGIEVPNRTVSTVTLKEVLASETMAKATAKAKSPLIVALGKDIAGTPIVCDLSRMPHLLIAGATGSGKSVCINTMINSLLYRCSPKEVRLILIDPKVVELQCYNGIPHLLIPVVSDPHKASGALAWAVAEMMDRYKKFEVKGVRSIGPYNASLQDGEEPLPRIVIVIDELADLMMTCKRDVEEHICRLAQLARAAGIHLVVATQRPSVNVITGLIKANIPSRIAFKVSSFVDSRTILDKIGAEQLLGNGDMLYQPTGDFTPTRVQGCYLSDDEVNDITDFIRSNCPGSYDPNVMEQLEELQRDADGSSPDDAETEDLSGDGSLLEQAIEMAVRDGQVSTSLIQRRLKIGYARAGRLVDEMEKRGIVGPKDGAKPRMCMITREEYEQMRSANQLAD